jgi:hypothetical protein
MRGEKSPSQALVPGTDIQVRAQHRRALRHTDVDLGVAQAAAAHHRRIRLELVSGPVGFSAACGVVVDRAVIVMGPFGYVAGHIQHAERTGPERIRPDPRCVAGRAY